MVFDERQRTIGLRSDRGTIGLAAVPKGKGPLAINRHSARAAKEP